MVSSRDSHIIELWLQRQASPHTRGCYRRDTARLLAHIVHIERWPIDRLKPYPKNARRWDAAAVAKVAGEVKRPRPFWLWRHAEDAAVMVART